MAGLGSFARGTGAYEVDDAQARAINLDTMIKGSKALRARQKELDAEKVRDDARLAAERDARSVRLALKDDTTLNRLLMRIAGFDPVASLT